MKKSASISLSKHIRCAIVVLETMSAYLALLGLSPPMQDNALPLKQIRYTRIKIDIDVALYTVRLIGNTKE